MYQVVAGGCKRRANYAVFWRSIGIFLLSFPVLWLFHHGTSHTFYTLLCDTFSCTQNMFVEYVRNPWHELSANQATEIKTSHRSNAGENLLSIARCEGLTVVVHARTHKKCLTGKHYYSSFASFALTKNLNLRQLLHTGLMEGTGVRCIRYSFASNYFKGDGSDGARQARARWAITCQFHQTERYTTDRK